jgi:hypothetical protein
MSHTERQIALTPESIVFSAKWRSGVQKEIAGLRRATVLKSYVRQSTLGPVDKAIAPVVELLAEAQVRRRQAPGDSAAFHSLTGAIVAYGKVLGVLSGLKQIQDETEAITSGSYPLRRAQGLLAGPAVAWSSGQSRERRA